MSVYSILVKRTAVAEKPTETSKSSTKLVSKYGLIMNQIKQIRMSFHHKSFSPLMSCISNLKSTKSSNSSTRRSWLYYDLVKMVTEQLGDVTWVHELLCKGSSGHVQSEI